jgi:hypothetical protein
MLEIAKMPLWYSKLSGTIFSATVPLITAMRRQKQQIYVKPDKLALE